MQTNISVDLRTLSQFLRLEAVVYKKFCFDFLFEVIQIRVTSGMKKSK